MLLFVRKVIFILRVVIFFCFGWIFLFKMFLNFYVIISELNVFNMLLNVLVKIDEFLVVFDVKKDMKLKIMVMINDVMDIVKVV